MTHGEPKAAQTTLGYLRRPRGFVVGPSLCEWWTGAFNVLAWVLVGAAICLVVIGDVYVRFGFATAHTLGEPALDCLLSGFAISGVTALLGREVLFLLLVSVGVLILFVIHFSRL